MISSTVKAILSTIDLFVMFLSIRKDAKGTAGQVFWEMMVTKTHILVMISQMHACHIQMGRLQIAGDKSQVTIRQKSVTN
jgi:hypothetical protein